MRTMPTVNAVEARGLELRHDGVVALSASNFTIPRTGVTALIGPNGSGKSTLLGAIAGIVTVASGTISVLGGPPAQARQRVSYVLQSTKVNESAPITVAEVVTMGRYSGRGLLGRLTATDRAAVDGALTRMDLDALAGRHLHELSGGQRQRVFVAQGLAQEHDILMLDEPLTGLDLLSAETIDAVIHEEHAEGRSVIITTHDLAEAGAADHVLLLAGRVVAAGPPDQVLVADLLAEAYGGSLLHVEQARTFLDDPAHQTLHLRHEHRERD